VGQVLPGLGKIKQHERDGEIGRRRQGVAAYREPENCGLPEVAMPMGHKIGLQQLLEKLHLKSKGELKV
jgi:hypothetical protein